MHGWPGSSLASAGYGCMMERMVAEWRSIWSVEPNTTDPLAPFGVVTIAPSGSEGADFHMSAFRVSKSTPTPHSRPHACPHSRPHARAHTHTHTHTQWAQTANYGVLPNPVMPRTYVAQAYDLNDPWAGIYRDPFDPPAVCSTNKSLE
jgi:hypothetical protein